jgi:hypothetical protein
MKSSPDLSARAKVENTTFDLIFLYLFQPLNEEIRIRAL